ncbi:hypothetical protein B0H17DRAFT_1141805 [Mycena rosella]|uniref:Protein kinase domain-containing protein n=1 Tax=Mycena rosella TaxID=1033263 RepID=A0AAD7CZ21_MYCRO|nr:hypothetical protein B0H17DRAFT_1141805 [Mycena rosella]
MSTTEPIRFSKFYTLFNYNSKKSLQVLALYRDVKPANILFDGNGNIILCNLGLGKYFPLSTDPREPDFVNFEVDPQRHFWESQVGGGASDERAVRNAGFASPDQQCGREYSYATDTWSLGASFFFMLTRRSPFPGNPQTHDQYSRACQEAIRRRGHHVQSRSGLHLRLRHEQRQCPHCHLPRRDPDHARHPADHEGAFPLPPNNFITSRDFDMTPPDYILNPAQSMIAVKRSLKITSTGSPHSEKLEIEMKKSGSGNVIEFHGLVPANTVPLFFSQLTTTQANPPQAQIAPTLTLTLEFLELAVYATDATHPQNAACTPPGKRINHPKPMSLPPQYYAAPQPSSEDFPDSDKIMDATTSYILSVHPDSFCVYPATDSQSHPDPMVAGLYSTDTVRRLLESAPSRVLHLSGNVAYNNLISDFQKILLINQKLRRILASALDETHNIYPDFPGDGWQNHPYAVEPILGGLSAPDTEALWLASPRTAIPSSSTGGAPSAELCPYNRRARPIRRFLLQTCKPHSQAGCNADSRASATIVTKPKALKLEEIKQSSILRYMPVEDVTSPKTAFFSLPFIMATSHTPAALVYDRNPYEIQISDSESASQSESESDSFSSSSSSETDPTGQSGPAHPEDVQFFSQFHNDQGDQGDDDVYIIQLQHMLHTASHDTLLRHRNSAHERVMSLYQDVQDRHQELLQDHVALVFHNHNLERRLEQLYHAYLCLRRDTNTAWNTANAAWNSANGAWNSANAAWTTANWVFEGNAPTTLLPSTPQSWQGPVDQQHLPNLGPAADPVGALKKNWKFQTVPRHAGPALGARQMCSAYTAQKYSALPGRSVAVSRLREGKRSFDCPNRESDSDLKGLFQVFLLAFFTRPQSANAAIKIVCPVTAPAEDEQQLTLKPSAARKGPFFAHLPSISFTQRRLASTALSEHHASPSMAVHAGNSALQVVQIREQGLRVLPPAGARPRPISVCTSDVLLNDNNTGSVRELPAPPPESPYIAITATSKRNRNTSRTTPPWTALLHGAGPGVRAPAGELLWWLDARKVDVRQLNYHLYLSPIPPSFSASATDAYFVPPSYALAGAQRGPAHGAAPRYVIDASVLAVFIESLGLNLPEEMQGYHTLIPLENIGGPTRWHKFGNWNSTMTPSRRLPPQPPSGAIEMWVSIPHLGVVAAFSDSLLIVAYVYHPKAQTLFDAHVKLMPPAQMQAPRMINVTKVFVTGTGTCMHADEFVVCWVGGAGYKLYKAIKDLFIFKATFPSTPELSVPCKRKSVASSALIAAAAVKTSAWNGLNRYWTTTTSENGGCWRKWFLPPLFIFPLYILWDVRDVWDVWEIGQLWISVRNIDGKGYSGKWPLARMQERAWQRVIAYASRRRRRSRDSENPVEELLVVELKKDNDVDNDVDELGKGGEIGGGNGKINVDGKVPVSLGRWIGAADW